MPYALDQERHILFPHELNVGIDDWFEAQARNYLQAGAEAHYGRRLAAGGAGLHRLDVREEILADFTGDALADPRFLEHLATQDPTKFQQFINAVVDWLKSVARKLSNAGFQSARYFD